MTVFGHWGTTPAGDDACYVSVDASIRAQRKWRHLPFVTELVDSFRGQNAETSRETRWDDAMGAIPGTGAYNEDFLFTAKARRMNYWQTIMRSRMERALRMLITKVHFPPSASASSEEGSGSLDGADGADGRRLQEDGSHLDVRRLQEDISHYAAEWRAQMAERAPTGTPFVTHVRTRTYSEDFPAAEKDTLGLAELLDGRLNTNTSAAGVDLGAVAPLRRFAPLDTKFFENVP